MSALNLSRSALNFLRLDFDWYVWFSPPLPLRKVGACWTLPGIYFAEGCRWQGFQSSRIRQGFKG